MITNTHKYLTEKGIKPSHQRIAVMEYLLNNATHPTAEMIYNALSPQMPTLSKTTVYNTLKLLAEKNAVLTLDIDGKNCRYDGDTSSHAHFICKSCGVIYDMPMAPVVFKNEMDLKVTDIYLFLKGYCNKCEKAEKC